MGPGDPTGSGDPMDCHDLVDKVPEGSEDVMTGYIRICRAAPRRTDHLRRRSVGLLSKLVVGNRSPRALPHTHTNTRACRRHTHTHTCTAHTCARLCLTLLCKWPEDPSPSGCMISGGTGSTISSSSRRRPNISATEVSIATQHLKLWQVSMSTNQPRQSWSHFTTDDSAEDYVLLVPLRFQGEMDRPGIIPAENTNTWSNWATFGRSRAESGRVHPNSENHNPGPNST